MALLLDIGDIGQSLLQDPWVKTNYSYAAAAD